VKLEQMSISTFLAYNWSINSSGLCFFFCFFLTGQQFSFLGGTHLQEYVPVQDDVVAQLKWEKEQVEYNSTLQVEIAH
jgi:hypothetical protein